MELIGNYLSPYVRRVAVSLTVVELPFRLQQLFVFKEPERVRPHNPVARIPTLLLDDGEVLVESYAILDAIDEMVGPERALTPPAGKERRHVMKLTALAVASMEKAQTAFYERRFKPEDRVHQPWIEKNENQALDGLRFLDDMAANLGEGEWLAGTARMSQADISATVAFTFVDAVRPHLKIADQVPHLARFAARCEALPAFRSAPLPEPVS